MLEWIIGIVIFLAMGSMCLSTYGKAVEEWGFWRVAWLIGSGASVWYLDSLGFPVVLNMVLLLPAAWLLCVIAMDIITRKKPSAPPAL